jgi:hypothetical protein
MVNVGRCVMYKVGSSILPFNIHSRTVEHKFQILFAQILLRNPLLLHSSNPLLRPLTHHVVFTILDRNQHIPSHLFTLIDVHPSRFHTPRFLKKEFAQSHLFILRHVLVIKMVKIFRVFRRLMLLRAFEELQELACLEHGECGDAFPVADADERAGG